MGSTVTYLPPRTVILHNDRNNYVVTVPDNKGVPGRQLGGAGESENCCYERRNKVSIGCWQTTSSSLLWPLCVRTLSLRENQTLVISESAELDTDGSRNGTFRQL